MKYPSNMIGCPSQIKEPINYEKKYKELKKEHGIASKYLDDKSEAQNNMILELDKELKECTKENENLKCQHEETKQHIINLEHQLKENKEKLDNYKAIKSLMKILSEGL